MANTEVGAAYVTIYPQTDGNFSKQVGQNIGNNVGTGLQSKAVMLGNIMSNIVMNAASTAFEGVTQIIGEAFTNYAQYEQLIGGVETLFGESADVVEGYAQQAYRTAGLSANAYMETVTGFSASLLQSLGGDTEAAAQYADMAVKDMSDNANKMGSDMQSIQNAYQGFAKQNYTMLDNLKLGYGGTKAEMERLLADASAIAGVEFNIDSYSDVIEAIHVMQEEMGIAGTTAEEAEHTISGSMDTLRAAWDNWLTSLASGDMDVKETTQKLIDAALNVLNNAIPAIQAILDSIGELIMAGLGELIGPENAEALRAGLVEAFEKLQEVAGGAGEAVMYLWDNVFRPFGSWLEDVFGPILGDIVDKLGGVSGIIDMIMSGLNPGYKWNKWSAEIFNATDGTTHAVQAMADKTTNAMSKMLQSADSTSAGINKSMDYSALVGKTETTFDAVNVAMTQPVADATSEISSSSGDIASSFSGLGQRITNAIGSIDFPKAHVTYSSIDVLGKSISIPKVEWYASGGFVNGATLIGAGERGPEMILPRSGGLMDMFAEELANKMGGGSTINVTVNAMTGADANEIAWITANKVSQVLAARGV